ncbi:hypothetical protein ACIPUB_15970 [Paeniglutamicibacter sp. ORCA_105]|uniref:hypothetical protein n=1 Tax=Paeniglutamicibacter sp. ORCA_105 TaxID=3377336 RepID=UPI0038942A0D
MDLNTVEAVVPTADPDAFRAGDAWLAATTDAPAGALGATLFEEMLIDGTVKVTTDVLRQYHVPAFADVPRSEIYFAKTTDSLGPLGAKPMSEIPDNPVAPALANALRDATGIGLTRTPFRRDDVYLALEAAGKVPPLLPAECLEVGDSVDVHSGVQVRAVDEID